MAPSLVALAPQPGVWDAGLPFSWLQRHGNPGMRDAGLRFAGLASPAMVPFRGWTPPRGVEPPRAASQLSRRATIPGRAVLRLHGYGWAGAALLFANGT